MTVLRTARKVRDTRITLAHGSGGKAMHDLIEDVFVTTFDDAALHPLEDQARLPLAELVAGRPARLYDPTPMSRMSATSYARRYSIWARAPRSLCSRSPKPMTSR